MIVIGFALTFMALFQKIPRCSQHLTYHSSAVLGGCSCPPSCLCHAQPVPKVSTWRPPNVHWGFQVVYRMMPAAIVYFCRRPAFFFVVKKRISRWIAFTGSERGTPPGSPFHWRAWNWSWWFRRFTTEPVKDRKVSNGLYGIGNWKRRVLSSRRDANGAIFKSWK